MTGFASSHSNESVGWRCHPSPSHAHQALLACLRRLTDGAFLSPGTALSDRRKGNLGEFVSFFVGTECAGMGSWHVCAANALNPLDDISRPGVDIVWLFFGRTPSQDRALLQEVKTSSTSAVSAAYGLRDDYAKLFSSDPECTLKTRLSAIKSRIEFEWRQLSLVRRVNRFMGVRPSMCEGVRVLPTLVFDPTQAGFPTAEGRLVLVRSTLLGASWDPTAVTPWAIGIENLDSHLQHLSQGR